jgi:hypothetical protein
MGERAMKKILGVILIVLFGSIGCTSGQAAKDVYKAVKKAEQTAINHPDNLTDAMIDARTEFDLFKDSKDANENPEFKKHITAALMSLAEAEDCKGIRLRMYAYALVEKGPGKAGPSPVIQFRVAMQRAMDELELAKKSLK